MQTRPSPPQPGRAWQRTKRARVYLGMVGTLLLLALLLAACGSTTSTSPDAPAASAQPASVAPATTSSNASAAAPSTTGSPSFVISSTTQDGDKVKVEGRFGPALPASESDVDQTALSECPQPTPDGRAFVVRLDLTTTVESSLAGEVTLETAHVDGGGIVNFVMGFSEGAHCDAGEPNEASVKLGMLQPGQPMDLRCGWLCPTQLHLMNRIHQNRPLAPRGWLTALMEPSVNGSSYLQDQHNSVGGSRVVKCSQPDEAPYEYLAVVADTPSVIHESECPVS